MINIFKKNIAIFIALTLMTKIVNGMEGSPRSYYGLLNVSRTATQEEIIQSFNESYQNIYYKFATDDSKQSMQIKTNFRKNVIAFMVLTNPNLKETYDNNPSHFEEPCHLYTILNTPIALQKGKKNKPKLINSENILNFFSEIPLETLSKCLIDANDSDAVCNAYLTLSDTGLRDLYHQNPTPSAFEEALKTYQIPVTPEPLQKIISEPSRTLHKMVATQQKKFGKHGSLTLSAIFSKLTTPGNRSNTLN